MRLGGMDGWVAVDTFGRYVSGPVWGSRQIGDGLVRSWTRSEDAGGARAALVSAAMLNLQAAGGTGDTDRTLDICERLLADRDDMVVKAMSWALRSLVEWDRDAVWAFLTTHGTDVAAGPAGRRSTSWRRAQVRGGGTLRAPGLRFLVSATGAPRSVAPNGLPGQGVPHGRSQHRSRVRVNQVKQDELAVGWPRLTSCRSSGTSAAWGITATVDAFARLGRAADLLPMIVRDDIGIGLPASTSIATSPRSP